MGLPALGSVVIAGLVDVMMVDMAVLMGGTMAPTVQSAVPVVLVAVAAWAAAAAAAAVRIDQ